MYAITFKPILADMMMFHVSAESISEALDFFAEYGLTDDHGEVVCVEKLLTVH